jgi:hypothetical protein
VLAFSFGYGYVPLRWWNFLPANLQNVGAEKLQGVRSTVLGFKLQGFLFG